MKRPITIKKIYFFTLISFVITFLFLYFFAESAPRFYTGFDRHTSPDLLSQVANLIFQSLLLINFIGIVLCILYPIKLIFKGGRN